MKTLLISADSRMRQTLGEVLKRRGHEPAVEEDADAARAACRWEAFPLVIFDADSPEDHGVQFCRRLRALPQGRRCVILAFGTHHHPEYLPTLFAAGADDYLADPAQVAQLEARLAVAEHRVRAAEEYQPAQGPAHELSIESFPLIYNAPFGVFRTSIEGRFLEVNPALVSMLGYDSEEELLQLDLARDVYQGPTARSQLIAKFGDGLPGAELDWKRKDGSPISVWATGRAVYDEAGAIVQFEGIIEDITEQKRAEEALKASEQQFRTFFENAVDGILLADVESKRFHSGNPMMCQMLGYAQEEIGNLGVMDIHPEEDLPHVLEQFEKQVRKEITLARDIPVKRKDGSVFYADINSFQITVSGKAYLAGIIRDVTQRKLAEEALRESERRYRLIADNVTDVIWTVNFNQVIDASDLATSQRASATLDKVTRQWQFDYFSPSVERLAGYRPEEAMKMSPQQMLAPDSYAIVKQVVAEEFARELSEPEEPFRQRRLELEYVRNDGSIRWCEVTATLLRDDRGRPVGALGVVRDVSERREAERALREHDAKLRGLLENLPDYVLILDRDGIVTFVNRTTPDLTREQVVGSDSFDYMAPEHQQRFRQTLQAAFESREVQAAEVQTIAGEWYEYRLVPMVEDESVRNVMLIATDVSKRKQAAEAIQKEQRLLRQLLDLHERDRRLIAYEIHDGVAQQLTGARFNFEAFDRLQGRDPDKARQAFDAGLQLLDDGMGEARRLISGLRPPILDELGIVAAIEHLTRESMRREGPEIEFFHDVRFGRLAPPLETAIFRIVQESLTNARRHSQSDKVRVELVQHDDRVKISVRDWGTGFNPAEIEENRSGLQGIRERVRLLGGKVVIETAPNQGTHIAVDLPLIEIAQEQTEP